MGSRGALFDCLTLRAVAHEFPAFKDCIDVRTATQNGNAIPQFVSSKSLVATAYEFAALELISCNRVTWRFAIAGSRLSNSRISCSANVRL